MVKKIFGNLLLQMGELSKFFLFFFVEAGKIKAVRNRGYVLIILLKAKVHEDIKV